MGAAEALSGYDIEGNELALWERIVSGASELPWAKGLKALKGGRAVARVARTATGTAADVLPDAAGRLSHHAGAAPGKIGKPAEEAVSKHIGVPRNTGSGEVPQKRIPGSGKGGYRVPDFDPEITVKLRGSVVEVKNVKNLSMTQQLRDLLEEARKRGGILEIFTDHPGPKSDELFEALLKGDVKLTPIP